MWLPNKLFDLFIKCINFIELPNLIYRTGKKKKIVNEPQEEHDKVFRRNRMKCPKA